MHLGFFNLVRLVVHLIWKTLFRSIRFFTELPNNQFHTVKISSWSVLHGSFPTQIQAVTLLSTVQESFTHLCAVWPTQTGSWVPLVPRPPDAPLSIAWWLVPWLKAPVKLPDRSKTGFATDLWCNYRGFMSQLKLLTSLKKTTSLSLIHILQS